MRDIIPSSRSIPETSLDFPCPSHSTQLKPRAGHAGLFSDAELLARTASAARVNEASDKIAKATDRSTIDGSLGFGLLITSFDGPPFPDDPSVIIIPLNQIQVPSFREHVRAKTED